MGNGSSKLPPIVMEVPPPSIQAGGISVGDAQGCTSGTGPCRLSVGKGLSSAVAKLERATTGEFSAATKVAIVPSLPFQVSFNGTTYKVPRMTIYHPSPIRIENVQHDAVLTLGDPSTPAQPTSGSGNGIILMVPLVGSLKPGPSGEFVGRIARYISGVLASDPVSNRYPTIDAPTGNDWDLSKIFPGSPSNGETVVDVGYFVWSAQPPMVRSSRPTVQSRPAPQADIWTYPYVPAAETKIRYIMLQSPIPVSVFDLQTIRMLPPTPAEKAIHQILPNSVSYVTPTSCSTTSGRESMTNREGYCGFDALPAPAGPSEMGKVLGGVLGAFVGIIAIILAVKAFQNPDVRAWLKSTWKSIGEWVASIGTTKALQQVADGIEAAQGEMVDIANPMREAKKPAAGPEKARPEVKAAVGTFAGPAAKEAKERRKATVAKEDEARQAEGPSGVGLAPTREAEAEIEEARREAESEAKVAEDARQIEQAGREAEADRAREEAEAKAKVDAEALAAAQREREEAEAKAKADAEDAARQAREAEAKAAAEAEDAARQAREAEAKAAAEAEAAQRAQEEAKAAADAEARQKAEADARAAEEARQKAEADAKAAAEAQQKAEVDAKAAEEARQKAEAEANAAEEERMRNAVMEAEGAKMASVVSLLEQYGKNIAALEGATLGNREGELAKADTSRRKLRRALRGINRDRLSDEFKGFYDGYVEDFQTLSKRETAAKNVSFANVASANGPPPIIANELKKRTDEDAAIRAEAERIAEEANKRAEKIKAMEEERKRQKEEYEKRERESKLTGAPGAEEGRASAAPPPAVGVPPPDPTLAQRLKQAQARIKRVQTAVQAYEVNPTDATERDAALAVDNAKGPLTVRDMPKEIVDQYEALVGAFERAKASRKAKKEAELEKAAAEASKDAVYGPEAAKIIRDLDTRMRAVSGARTAVQSLWTRNAKAPPALALKLKESDVQNELERLLTTIRRIRESMPKLPPIDEGHVNRKLKAAQTLYDAELKQSNSNLVEFKKMQSIIDLKGGNRRRRKMNRKSTRRYVA